jgi:hypothetical protein
MPPHRAVLRGICGFGLTFSVFLEATGAIPLDPGKSRVSVRFNDASGAVLGATSVAVEAQ